MSCPAPTPGDTTMLSRANQQGAGQLMHRLRPAPCTSHVVPTVAQSVRTSSESRHCAAGTIHSIMLHSSQTWPRTLLEARRPRALLPGRQCLPKMTAGHLLMALCALWYSSWLFCHLRGDASRYCNTQTFMLLPLPPVLTASGLSQACLRHQLLNLTDA